MPDPGPDGNLYPISTCSFLKRVTLGSGTWSSIPTFPPDTGPLSCVRQCAPWAGEGPTPALMMVVLLGVEDGVTVVAVETMTVPPE